MNSATRSSKGLAPEEAVSRRAQDKSRRSAARPLCIHRLIEAQAERTPEAVALSCAGESLTYVELNARANRLARRLRALGVGPEVLVGLCVCRSTAMVVGLLAVLKAGAPMYHSTRTIPLNALPSCSKTRTHPSSSPSRR